MKGILLLSRSMIVIFAFACLFAGESAVQAQPKVPVVERFAGKVTKINNNTLTVQVDNGTKTVNLNEFDEITYIKRGREVPFNINDAELRKLKITIERTVEEDKNGKKKRKLKITIST